PGPARSAGSNRPRAPGAADRHRSSTTSPHRTTRGREGFRGGRFALGSVSPGDLGAGLTGTAARGRGGAVSPDQPEGSRAVEDRNWAAPPDAALSLLNV